jgi:hypothetical protein
MEDITDQLDDMAKAMTAAMMNSECNDPIVPVIVLGRLLCELLVELGMDDEDKAVEAFRDSLRSARKNRDSQEVH